MHATASIFVWGDAPHWHSLSSFILPSECMSFTGSYDDKAATIQLKPIDVNNTESKGNIKPATTSLNDHVTSPTPVPITPADRKRRDTHQNVCALCVVWGYDILILAILRGSLLGDCCFTHKKI